MKKVLVWLGVILATVLLGVMAGHLLRSGKRPWAKVGWLVAAGVGCLILGRAWGRAFPIIKHIWTSTYVLWAGGWCLLLMAAFYWIMQIILQYIQSKIEARLAGHGVRVPLLSALFPQFASRLIRNGATLGGNLANASPAADTAPALLVTDADGRFEIPAIIEGWVEFNVPGYPNGPYLPATTETRGTASDAP